MCFEFTKPAGYDGGALKWRVWGTSAELTEIWRWKISAPQGWVKIDDYMGADPGVQTCPTPIPASWFNADGDCYIMATCDEDPNDHNIIADRIDIQW